MPTPTQSEYAPRPGAPGLDRDSRNVILGVTGGIAAYKSPDLARRLIEHGCRVRAVMTQAAGAFVTPLTFQAVTGERVGTSLLDESAEAAMGHIELARWADLVLVAPASADFLARLAHGMADDLLATLCLATSAPVAVAPAMNQVMWSAAATRANVATLEARGIAVLGPGEGDQACGEVGAGRMLEPLDIAGRAAALLGNEGAGALSGLDVLVTAGPTREAIDPVRYVTNYSSGKMGYAVARAAARTGARVTLVSGPTALAPPAGVLRVDVESASEMLDAVMSRAAGSAIFVAAAAVADYRPRAAASAKIKKADVERSLELVRNPDILARVAAMDGAPFTVGFAAETEDVALNARKKLEDKRLDMIAANRVGRPGSGFDADDNAMDVYWFDHGELEHEALELAPKRAVAERLVSLVAQRYAGRRRVAQAG